LPAQILGCADLIAPNDKSRRMAATMPYDATAMWLFEHQLVVVLKEQPAALKPNTAALRRLTLNLIAKWNCPCPLRRSRG
jgi:hypothetical protein